MNRDILINKLTEKGYYYNWSKYSTEQLFRMYQKNVLNLKVIQKPIYNWFLQTEDGSWLQFKNYRNFLKAKKEIKYLKAYKLKVGEYYEAEEVHD